MRIAGVFNSSFRDKYIQHNMHTYFYVGLYCLYTCHWGMHGGKVFKARNPGSRTRITSWLLHLTRKLDHGETPGVERCFANVADWLMLFTVWSCGFCPASVFRGMPSKSSMDAKSGSHRSTARSLTNRQNSSVSQRVVIKPISGVCVFNKPYWAAIFWCRWILKTQMIRT